MSSLRAWTKPEEPKSNLHRSRRQEKNCANRLGGRVTKASGATPYEKGDVRLKGVVRVECKSTKHKSFSVTEEIISAIEAATMGAGEVPVIEVELGSGRRVYIVPAWAMDDLLERANQ